MFFHFHHEIRMDKCNLYYTTATCSYLPSDQLCEFALIFVIPIAPNESQIPLHLTGFAMAVELRNSRNLSNSWPYFLPFPQGVYNVCIYLYIYIITYTWLYNIVVFCSCSLGLQSLISMFYTKKPPPPKERKTSDHRIGLLKALGHRVPICLDPTIDRQRKEMLPCERTRSSQRY